MGTSCSPIGSARHRIGRIHRGETLVIAAEPGVSGIGVGVVPYRGIRDNGTHACSDLDCSISETRSDINVAQRGSEVDVRSGSLEPDPPPLLSRDLHSSCRDLHFASPEHNANELKQKLLPGFDPPETLKTQRHPARTRPGRLEAPPVDALVHSYLSRLSAHGAAARGVSAYQYQIRATLRIAARLSGETLTMAEVFQDDALLGRTLVHDESAQSSTLSKWTLAQRRSAIRSFATLMRPELLPLIKEEPSSVVERALRLVAERVGGGYRLTGGAPRRRGGRAPDHRDISAVLGSVGSAPGFTGRRNRAFFGILAATGCRVNALRELDGGDWLVLPNGRMRIYLHEKGKVERREVELSREAARDLMEYTAAFNRLVASRRWKNRVECGKPGAVWRNTAGSRWGYASVLKTLKDGCIHASVPEFAPHALRRAFASDAASRLPRHVVAQAGGWKGLERLDDHYIQPHETTIWEKLNWLGQETILTTTEMEMNDAAVGAL